VPLHFRRTLWPHDTSENLVLPDSGRSSALDVYSEVQSLTRSLRVSLSVATMETLWSQHWITARHVPFSPYQHLKQRKISSSVGTSMEKTSNCIDFSNEADAQSAEKIKELEKENKNLKNRNMEILDQLHVAQSSVYSLESSLDSHKSTVKLLERRVRALEDERDALLHMVANFW
jgi:hypothetical protein